MPPKTSPDILCSCLNCAASPLIIRPPIPSSIQFLYSSVCSSVVAAVVDLPSLVSPAKTAVAAKVPAQTSTRNLGDALIIRSISIPKQRVHLRTVNGFVTARRPTRALRQEVGVIGVSDKYSAGLCLLLEVALQAKRCVAFV